MKEEKDKYIEIEYRKALFIELSNCKIEIQNQEMIISSLKKEKEQLNEIIKQYSDNNDENYEAKLKNENLMKRLSESKNTEYDQLIKIDDLNQEVF
jgi:antitoxin component of MazEF toxin-antitoxin module